MSRSERGSSFLQKYVPAHFQDPVGLATRLLKTGDRAAFYAMWTAGLGLALTPLDLLLSLRERELYEHAPEPELPLVLVCGPSRAGTTLTEQILITSTRPAYLNNLSSLFPRSPLIANRVFADYLEGPAEEFRFFYGKSVGLSGPNDALYLWDRWLGPGHRVQSPTPDAELDLASMRRFFGAVQHEYGLPVVNKNNHLNCCAHLVAPALPTATFFCLKREREHLAQSLLRARRDIHGDLSVPYGIASPVDDGGLDPIDSVCRQVLYHERMAHWQQEQLGSDRFRIVIYEELCRDPLAFAAEVSDELLAGTGRRPRTDRLSPFEPSTRLRVSEKERDEIVETLGRLDPEEELWWREPSLTARQGRTM